MIPLNTFLSIANDYLALQDFGRHALMKLSRGDDDWSEGLRLGQFKTMQRLIDRLIAEGVIEPSAGDAYDDEIIAAMSLAKTL